MILHLQNIFIINITVIQQIAIINSLCFLLIFTTKNIISYLKMFNFLKSSKIHDIKDHFRQIKQSHSSSNNNNNNNNSNNKLIKNVEKQPVQEPPKHQFIRQRISFTQGANQQDSIIKRRQKQKDSFQKQSKQQESPGVNNFNQNQNTNTMMQSQYYPYPPYPQYSAMPNTNMHNFYKDQNLRNSQLYFNGYQYPPLPYMGNPYFNPMYQNRLQEINQIQNQDRYRTPSKQKKHKEKKLKREPRKKNSPKKNKNIKSLLSHLDQEEDEEIIEDKHKTIKDQKTTKEQIQVLIQPIREIIEIQNKKKENKILKKSLQQKIEIFKQTFSFQDYINQIQFKFNPFKKGLNIGQKIQQNHKKLIYMMNDMNQQITRVLTK